MYVFRGTIALIEERHEVLSVVKTGKVGPDGKSELQSNTRSLGWFVVLEEMPVALRVSAEKPALSAGQVIEIELRPVLESEDDSGTG